MPRSAPRFAPRAAAPPRRLFRALCVAALLCLFALPALARDYQRLIIGDRSLPTPGRVQPGLLLAAATAIATPCAGSSVVPATAMSWC
jgi:hypothetical protein